MMTRLAMILGLLAHSQEERSGHPWAGFEPGAWGEFRVTTTIGSGSEAKVVASGTATYTLESVDKTAAIVSVTSVIDRKTRTGSQRYELRDWTGWPKADRTEGVGLGERNLSCRVMRTVSTGFGHDVEVETWICDAVPGHVVKTVVETRGPALQRIETTLVDFSETKREAKPEAKAKGKFKYDSFESWNAFKEGSMVEFEMETAGMKLVETKTIDRKHEDVIHLKTEVTLGGNVIPGTEDVKKPTAIPTGDCPLCQKPIKDHKDEGKWSEETLKVDGKDVKCHKWESPEKRCDGEDMVKFTIWYSEEVPGHMVRFENAQMKMILTNFEAKK